MKLPFYLEAVYKSILDISWLKARRQDGMRAGKYFVGLLLVVAIANAVMLTRFSLNTIKDATKKITDAAPELLLEKKENKLVASGISQPFVHEITVEDVALYLYIDTTTSSASVPVPAAVMSKETVMLAVFITNDKIRFIDGESGKEHTILATDLPDNSIIPTGKTVKQIAELIGQPRTFFVVFAFFTLALFVINTILQAAYLAALTLIVWCVVRIKQAAWTYGELFAVGMFAATLPMIIGDILPMFGAYVPFIASAVWVGLLLGVVWKKGKVQEGVEAGDKT